MSAVRVPATGTRKPGADCLRKRGIRGVGALLGGVAVRNAGLEPASFFELRGAKRKRDKRPCRHPTASDDSIRQPVRDGVPVFDGIPPTTDGSLGASRVALSCALLSSAAAVCNRAEIHGRLRIVGRAATRYHGGKCGGAIEGHA